ncbi:MAG: RES family NAD+ phosphorylase [Bacteroidetes bacterium]|nr:RES family NAD+ phosphorylase [Bacteroidota bacterium]MBS1931344.1 RES family NAD+ phosphorylase [Bacteroidota bacterium]
MELYRIAQEKYADDLSGNGARIFGGRWNSEGLFALYTSSSRSLSLLEILAHTPAKMLKMRTYVLITLWLPDNVRMEALDKNKLSSGWDAPDTRLLTKKLGDKFLRNRSSLLLTVPSVLMPEENNYLVNTVHPDMKKLKINFKRRIYFDARLAAGL